MNRAKSSNLAGPCMCKERALSVVGHCGTLSELPLSSLEGASSSVKRGYQPLLPGVVARRK